MSTLPTLGLPDIRDEPSIAPEALGTQRVAQVGQMLSNGDPVDTFIGYARSVGESLINQRITD